MGKETDVTLNRERGIGGSDIPTIMGINPFVSRLDLLQFKVGNKTNDFEGNEYTAYGNILEPKIRDFINKDMGFDFKPDYRECETDKALALYYHSDGADDSEEALLEIKTTSEIHDDLKGYKRYLVQLMYGMWMHKWNKGMLAVYERPEDFRENEEFDSSRLQIFSVGFDNPLMAEIQYAIEQFRLDFVYMQDNPMAEEYELPSCSTLMPYAEKIMNLEDSLAMANQIVNEYKQAKEDILEQMIKFNIKSWTMPNGTKLTVVPQGEDKTVKKFDEKKFSQDHPVEYEEYLYDAITKGKKAYLRASYPILAKGE